jgi:ATP-dependent DNA ligase
MFCDVLQSNPRIGIGATDLNKKSELLRIPQFKVHLCARLKEVKHKIDFTKDWLIQTKLDGNRIIGIKDIQAKLLSRKGIERKSLNHILDILNKRSDSFVVDGEVEYLDSLEATGSIRRVNKQCKEATFTLFGEYQISQWLSERHTDPYQECYDRAKAFVDSLTDYEKCFVRIVPSYHIGSFSNIDDWLKAVEKYYEEFLELGYEGAIVKTTTHTYLPSSGSKRSIETIKIKPWQDMEATVIGFNESDTNPDSLGSFKCITKDGKEFDVALGNIRHEERDYIWRNPHKFVDKELEFKYQQLSIYGIPRHPTAVKFRG